MNFKKFFDPKQATEGVVLQKDNAIASFPQNREDYVFSGGVLLQEPLNPQTRYYASFKLVRNNRVLIGVTSKLIDSIDRHREFTGIGLHLYSGNVLSNHHNKGTNFGRYLDPGDVLEVFFFRDENKMAFSVNKTDYKFFTDEIFSCETLYFIVTGTDTEVELCEFKIWTQEDEDARFGKRIEPALPTEENIEKDQEEETEEKPTTQITEKPQEDLQVEEKPEEEDEAWGFEAYDNEKELEAKLRAEGKWVSEGEEEN